MVVYAHSIYTDYSEMVKELNNLLSSDRRPGYLSMEEYDKGEYELNASFKYKNPSGFHNKIKWLLHYSDRDIEKLSKLYNSIMKRTGASVVSWNKAFKAARFIIQEKTNGRFKTFEEEKEAIENIEIIGPMLKMNKDIIW
jgi:hypothetical protein